MVAASNLPDIEWRQTWDDDLEREDYCAWHGERRIGRIYPDSLAGEHFWRWFPGWAGSRGQNRCESRREAMIALEDAYLNLIEKHPNPATLFF